MKESEAVRDLAYKLFLQWMTKDAIDKALAQNEQRGDLIVESKLVSEYATVALSVARSAVSEFSLDGLYDR
jgi:hypothetical protein